MFGRRGNGEFGNKKPKSAPVNPAIQAQATKPVVQETPNKIKPTQPVIEKQPEKPKESAPENKRTQEYYATKASIFNALVEAIDLSQLSRLEQDDARDEIRDVVNDIIALKNLVMSIAEQEDLLEDICNDVLGYGPLEPLLARDDIADIMVNGANTVYIETDGMVEQTGIQFRDNRQLMNICQRIVSQVGRRVDESSPICDARLPDGSRVNVIAPPLSLDGPASQFVSLRKTSLRWTSW